MTVPPPEDADLARRLIADDSDAWRYFEDQIVARRLLPCARRLLPKGITTAVMGTLTPEDVVRAFVDERVVARKVVMLAPVVRGERSLVPRLIGSVKNFVRDLLAKRRDRPAELERDIAAPPAEELEDVAPVIEDRAREALDLLASCRSAKPALRDPQYAVLVLDVRLEAVSVIRTELMPEPVSVVVGTRVSWRPVEARTRALAGGPTLLEVWSRLVPRADDPAAQLDDGVLATVMGISTARLWQWRRRGRLRVQELDADRSRLLFPTWPSRGTP